ncbi:MAG: hypothetical protein Q9195_006101 [Heterodermia aff. obscurata]
MDKRVADYADAAYRPSQKYTYCTGNDVDCDVNLSSYHVEASDVGRRSELQEGTLISVGDTVEMTNGHIIKIGRMCRNNLGAMMLLGELFILHDDRLPVVRNAVFWSYYTTNGVEEFYLEHNLVELRKVKRLRKLLMITPDQLVPGSIQHQMPNAFSDPPALICGWKHITLGSANGESTEESFRPLIASEADIAIAPHDCGHSQYDSTAGLSSFSNLTISSSAQPRQYTFGDIFCGAGGMSRGAEQAGLFVSWGLDSDPCAAAAFGMNFPTANILQMSDIDLCNLYPRARPPVRTDILHMSSPCQLFSNNHTIAGPDDEEKRACLDRMGRILEVIKPRIVTFENVPGLLLRHQTWFNLVLQSFTSSGYSVRWKLIQCAEHGVPQMRRLLFIIAARLGENLPPFPAPTHGCPTNPFVTIAQAINNIPPNTPDHDPVAHPNHPTSKHPMNRPLLNTYSTHLWHPTAGRRFTVRETASLQGFPLEHRFEGADGVKLRQIGNAVPPPVARAILQEVRKSLLRTDGLI